MRLLLFDYVSFGVEVKHQYESGCALEKTKIRSRCLFLLSRIVEFDFPSFDVVLSSRISAFVVPLMPILSLFFDFRENNWGN